MCCVHVPVPVRARLFFGFILYIFSTISLRFMIVRWAPFNYHIFFSSMVVDGAAGIGSHMWMIRGMRVSLCGCVWCACRCGFWSRAGMRRCRCRCVPFSSCCWKQKKNRDSVYFLSFCRFIMELSLSLVVGAVRKGMCIVYVLCDAACLSVAACAARWRERETGFFPFVFRQGGFFLRVEAHGREVFGRGWTGWDGMGILAWIGT